LAFYQFPIEWRSNEVVGCVSGQTRFNSGGTIPGGERTVIDA
jgi:hypothetical protein